MRTRIWIVGTMAVLAMAAAAQAKLADREPGSTASTDESFGRHSSRPSSSI